MGTDQSKEIGKNPTLVSPLQSYEGKDDVLAYKNKAIHAGSASTDIDDIEGMIERGGCANAYYKMEECLGEYDRDWTKCQETVQELKQCNDTLAKR